MENNDLETSSEGSDFVATEEMLNFAYDDESTINEEEDIEDVDEIDNLKRESEMPLEELLRLYGSKNEECVKDNGIDDDEFSGEESSGSQTSVTDNPQEVKRDNGINIKQSGEFDCEQNQRNNSRLWCKDLIDSTSNYNSEDDGDYIPLVDSKYFANAKTRIGDSYQTIVPDRAHGNAEDYYSTRIYEILVWKPKDQYKTIDTLRGYLKQYGEISGLAPLTTGNTDDATALYTLMEHDYDVNEALCYTKNKPVQPADFPNIMQTWTEQECAEFEKGFETHNKNFRLIKEQRLRSRTISEIVEFYYFWKKTARYDEFIRWCKRDKRKPITQITDLLDCLAPESSNGGRKEKYLLGNWRGSKPDNSILNVSDEAQTAKFLAAFFKSNSNEGRTVFDGTWNVTSSLAAVDKNVSKNTSTNNISNSNVN